MAASAEDKVKIATHYLLSAPPGQVAEVERDVLALLGAGIDAARLEGVYRAYNTANHVVVRVPPAGGAGAAGGPAPGTTGLVLSAEGAVDAAGTTYLDSHGKRLFKIAHRSGTAEQASEPLTAEQAAALPQLDPALEAHRSTLATMLLVHVGNAYNAMGAGTQAWARGVEVYAKDGALVVVASALVRNLANFWSGAWRARYSIGFPAGVAAGKAVLSGSIRITTHYFENGNTQMHNEKAVGPVSLDYRDAESLGKAVVKAVAAAEDGLQESLEDMYESLSSNALKEMRRFLPVSAQKMNWNVLEHRMRRTLAAAGGPAAGAGGK